MIRRDRVFLLFLFSGVIAYLVQVAFAVVLPISLVSSHGFSPATWGFLVVVNPLLVTLFQLRLTRRVTWISPATKLFVSMLLMELPFLLLSLNASLLVVVVILVVVVVGEMLWVPTSQTAAAGFALGPLLDLQVRHAFGDTAMWVCSSRPSRLPRPSRAQPPRGASQRARARREPGPRHCVASRRASRRRRGSRRRASPPT